jgi:hypothetical protein
MFIRKQFFLKSLVGLLSVCAMAARADQVNVRYSGCDAPVSVQAHDVPLRSLLTELADQMGFVLISNPAINQRIDFSGSYTADSLFRQLLRGHNTMLSYQADERCAGGRAISELVLMKKGELVSSTELERHVPRELGASVTTRSAGPYVIVEDMDDHVEAVIEGKARAQKRNMTPEQREEFMRMKKERGKWRNK